MRASIVAVFISIGSDNSCIQCSNALTLRLVKSAQHSARDQTRRLQRAIPRRDRRHVRETALAYADARRVKFERWVNAAKRTATRVALLLCDELEPLAEDIRSQIAPERETRSATLENHSGYREALSFWASAPAMHLRQHMGLITQL